MEFSKKRMRKWNKKEKKNLSDEILFFMEKYDKVIYCNLLDDIEMKKSLCYTLQEK